MLHIRLLSVMVVLALGTMFPQSSQAQAAPLCFNVPGITNCIEGRFLDYWRQNGGLPVFGYPISPATQQNNGEGTFLTQYFERNRFEYHGDKSQPYDVLLGRLGVDRLNQQGHNWFTFPKADPSTPHYFAETSHAIGTASFWAYWSSHGLEFDGKAGTSMAESLALWGYPISEPTMETNSSGDTVLTQWFERARFEDHGAQGVLLGLLGNETTRATTPPTPAPPTPTPPVNPCADAPAPVSASVHPSNCVTKGTRVVMGIYGFKPNESIGFWLTSPDGVAVGTVQTYLIGPSGAASGLGLDTSDPVFVPGLWYIVFEGTTSHHRSIVYIKILPPGTNPLSSQ